MLNRSENEKKYILSLIILGVIVILSVILVSTSRATTTAPETLIMGEVVELHGLGTDASSMHMRKTTDGTYVYCLEANRGNVDKGNVLNLEVDDDYTTETGALTDNGIVYLSANGFPNKTITGDEQVDYAITQLAIWMYYYRHPTQNIPSTLAKAVLDDQYDTSNEKYVTIALEAEKLCVAAEDARENGLSSAAINVDIIDNVLKISDNNNYIESEVMTVTLDEISEYEVTVTNDEFVIVDEIGNAKTTFENGDKFKIQIPESKVNDDIEVSVNLVADNEKYIGYRYNPEQMDCSNLPAGWTCFTKQRILYTQLETLGEPIEEAISFSYRMPTGTVEVSKQDAITGISLSGANFKITNENGDVVEEWISDEGSYAVELNPGTYTLTETSAPSGYVKSSEEVTITVSNDGTVEPNSIVITNAPIEVDVVINKTDADTGKALSGAKLKLVDSSDEVVEEWTTGITSHTIKLNPGTYTLTETSAPSGYIKSEESIYITVNKDGTVTPSNVVITNKKIEVDVIINKTDADTGKALPGAKLKIVDSNGDVVEEWTTGTISHTIKLNPGTYTLTETSAPSGYVKSNEEVTITVNNDGTVTPSNVVITNKKIEVDVIINKTDADTGKALPGAKLKLVDSSDEVVEEWTSTTTSHTIKLNPGTYVLTEIEAPEWYVRNDESIEFTVKADGTTIPSSIVMKNVLMNEVIINKQDATTGNELAGARLEILDTNDNIVVEWTSTSTPYSLKLKPGKYTLRETVAPDGYMEADIINFIVNYDGTTIPSSIVMKNESLKEIVITKIDSVTGKNLVGAKLKLVDESGDIIDEWISSTTAHILKVIPGKYILTEIEAPEWYVRNEIEIHITVNNDGTTNPSSIVMENIPMKEVVISTQDVTTGNELVGAKLMLLDEVNSTVAEWTSTNEPYSIKLKPGKYIANETSVPNNYVNVTEMIEFTVNVDGTTSPSNIVLENIPFKEILINKLDSITGENVAGAKLKLVNSDGKIIDEWISSTTAHTLKVIPGKYILTEIEAPEWYVKNQTPIEIIVNNDGSTSPSSIGMENVPMKEVVISKQDITTGKELAGARLKILDVNDNIVAEWSSTSIPYSLKLKPGKYTLSEISAPNDYMKSSEVIEFTVRSDGSTSPSDIVFENIPLRKISIIKQDSETGQNVSGAKLKLVDDDGNLIDEWTSSTTAHILKVIPGKYLLTEIEAPEWYLRNETSLEITVNNDGSTSPSSIVMTNKPVKEVVISKQDATTGKEVAGANLKLIDSSGKVIDKWTSTTIPHSLKLKQGKYTLIETSAPKGYIESKEQLEFTVDEEGNTNPTNIILDNIPIKTISISKKDSVNGIRIAGAKLRLLDESGTVVDEWISETIAHTLELTSGTYTLIEVEAPEWYVKNQKPVQFKVDIDGIAEPFGIVMENQPIKEVVVSKQDFDTGKELAGARLKIVDEDGNKVIEWTSTEKPYSLKLKPGNYSLIEIQAPEWYVKEKEPIKFVVGEDGTTNPGKIIMKNKSMKEIVISKQDSDTGKEVVGAKLRIIDESGNKVAEWTSTEKPYSLKLKPGKYNLMEIEAPEWYVKKNEPINFIVNEDGTTNLGEIVMSNKPMKEVVISKRDSETNKELPGAELKLYDENNNLVDEWTSTDESYSLNLKSGKYKLIEVEAPEWYVKEKEPIEFIVSEDGTTNLGEIVMSNKPMKEVVISKRDSTTEKELSGAKLKLVDINDNLVDEWISNNKPHSLKLKPGKYLLSEIKAPEGYVKSDEVIEFIVYEDGTTDLGEVIMINKYIDVPKTALNTQKIITISCGVFGALGIGLVIFMKRKIKYA